MRRVGTGARLLAAVVMIAILAAATVVARGVDRPWFDHVYLIVLENRSDTDITDSADAPFLNSLIAGYGTALDYHAVAHPSQPNYFMLTAGSTFGIAEDGVHDVNAPNLFDQIEAHGRSWHVYAQDYPGGCFRGDQADGGVDLVGAPGAYVRRHNPAISFTDVAQGPGRCANITSLASFDPAAADFEMIIPNGANNMHDGSVAQADQFLAQLVPRILKSPDFARSVLFITCDEGTTDDGGGGRVPLIVVRPGIAAGFTSPTTHSHRSLLRTIEDGWVLGCLADTCGAHSMGEFFGG